MPFVRTFDFGAIEIVIVIVIIVFLSSSENAQINNNIESTGILPDNVSGKNIMIYICSYMTINSQCDLYFTNIKSRCITSTDERYVKRSFNS